MWPIAIFCVLALCVDLTVHIAALLGFNPQEWLKPTSAGELGFVGLLAATVLLALAANRIWQRRWSISGGVPREYVPTRGFKMLRNVALAYGVFILLYFGAPSINRGNPVEQGAGWYVLDPGHGHAGQPITKGQYDQYRREGVVACSGFFLVFYIPAALEVVAMALGTR